MQSSQIITVQYFEVTVCEPSSHFPPSAFLLWRHEWIYEVYLEDDRAPLLYSAFWTSDPTTNTEFFVAVELFPIFFCMIEKYVSKAKF